MGRVEPPLTLGARHGPGWSSKPNDFVPAGAQAPPLCVIRCRRRGVGALPPVSNRAGNSQPLVAVTHSYPGQGVRDFMQENLFGFILGSRFAQIPGEGYASIPVAALAKAGLCVVPGE